MSAWTTHENGEHVPDAAPTRPPNAPEPDPRRRMDHLVTWDVPQLDAFATPAADAPRARLTDPPTSHAAAKRAATRLGLKQLAVLDVFQYGTGGRTLTHEELIERYGARLARLQRCAWYPSMTDSSIRTRCKELVTLGHVRHVDDAGITKSGGKSARWATTPSGQVLDIDAYRRTLDRAASVARARRR